jgi:hypothetical protein
MSIMHSMSEAEKTKYRAYKTNAMREDNSELIRDLGISSSDFNMKTPFSDNQGRLVVGIFPSEFKKTKGFFFELIDSDLNPTDLDRKVYRVPPSQSFDDEYELNVKGSYLVPLEELRIVNRDSVAISKSSAVTASDAIFKPTQKAQQDFYNFEKAVATKEPPIQKAPAIMEDGLYSEMTIRDYFAIHSGKPVSTKVWLNDLIKNK